ncbi:alpha/beta fold hydrolase [Pseudalkalibacillus hwajinpoensis]|uniref:Alpha/beta hydrolase n=1 Tax=Guptibacillus hwajinpoensis TaxID=208199 RepID=A0A4V5PYH5_9BACL|nr:alpha/beta hydrolase [Pseudalkalibacillus hwajinpoensis]TKD70098.1 alpha/beta hydrolase [Pseudalkalibacillus hwajinpoensis]
MTWNQNFIETDRGTFEVFSKGDGPPLCVTHLYSEFNESGDYFADTFSESHTVYLVNLREAGRSDVSRAPHELFMIESVFDLESIRRALRINQWVFAGHSTGGMLACVYGIHASSSLRAMIAVGAAAREYGSSSEACIYHEEHPDYHLMQDYIETLKDPELDEKKRKFISEARTKLSLYKPEQYDNYFSKSIHKKMATARMNFFAREILQFDVTKQLHHVNAPTLVMCGKYDVQCPLVFSEEMAAEVPGAQLAVFNNSNHYPFLEEEQTFKRVVHQFIEEVNELSSFQL